MSVVTAPEVRTPEPLVEPDPDLMRAAEIVRRRWQQGASGDPGGPRCVLGAIREASNRDWVSGLDYPAYQRFNNSLGLGGIVDWNDAPGRTAEEVAEALERAAYGL